MRERPDLGEPIEGGTDYLRAEAYYAASHEGALHLDDVLTRRLRVSIETADRGRRAADSVGALVGEALGWDGATVQREIERFRRRVEAELASQEQPDDQSAVAVRRSVRDPGPDDLRQRARRCPAARPDLNEGVAMHALCIDVGTSMIKTVAFDRQGHEVAVARQPTRVLRAAPGHAEQDMAEVWNGVVQTLRTANQEIAGDVEMIALTAQGDGCWLVDEAGEPVGRAGVVERRAQPTDRRDLETRRHDGARVPHERVAELPGPAQRDPELAAGARAGADRTRAQGVVLRRLDFCKLTGELAVTSPTPRRRSWTSARARTPASCSSSSASSGPSGCCRRSATRTGAPAR